MVSLLEEEAAAVAVKVKEEIRLREGVAVENLDGCEEIVEGKSTIGEEKVAAAEAAVKDFLEVQVVAVVPVAVKMVVMVVKAVLETAVAVAAMALAPVATVEVLVVMVVMVI